MRGKKSRKKVAVMSALALGMLALVTFPDASAYFTTYVSAGGSQIVYIGSQTEIHEDVVNMTKRVSITNTSQTNDCFVRVKVFCSSQLPLSYENESGLWSEGTEGYWYYGSILPAGASTEILNVKIGELPADYDRDSFNVIVIQECTPVVYDKEGNPTADWNQVYTEYQEIADGQGEGA